MHCPSAMKRSRESSLVLLPAVTGDRSSGGADGVDAVRAHYCNSKLCLERVKKELKFISRVRVGRKSFVQDFQVSPNKHFCAEYVKEFLPMTFHFSVLNRNTHCLLTEETAGSSIITVAVSSAVLLVGSWVVGIFWAGDNCTVISWKIQQKNRSQLKWSQRSPEIFPTTDPPPKYFRSPQKWSAVQSTMCAFNRCSLSYLPVV